HVALDEADALERAEGAWGLVAALLAEAREAGASRVALDVGTSVRWQWIAETLSVALEAGLDVLEIEGIPSAWRLEAPGPGRFVDPTNAMAPGPALPLTLLGVLAAGAVFCAIPPPPRRRRRFAPA